MNPKDIEKKSAVEHGIDETFKPEVAQNIEMAGQNMTRMPAPGAVDRPVDHAQEDEIRGFEENFRVISPGRMVAKRFLRSKLSIAGMIMVIFVFLFSFVGPLITDMILAYGETEVHRIERIFDLV